MIETVSSIASSILGRYESNPHWDHWPFGPGYGDFWASALKMLFVAAILGAILLFLRVLFGPNGKLRDPELDREAAEMREKALQELEEELKNGEISELDYKYKKKRILS
ncbi:SHOCT domain-containing protein [Maridesulfovibrio sp.]|uniref:SHOCT domain-containing protein n=1 Tax=Maridesulfovibrio sp. TaxID=2795000 RepID=UPI002A18E1D0|nr:SHOCT domain-containing protein [Maridesulfovibrio sp.]